MNRQIAIGTALCGLVLLVVGVLFVWFPVLYLLFTYEDRVVEWMQVYLLLIAGGLFFYQASRQHSYRLFFMLMVLLCFYVVGEELSWGQRLFGMQVPELFLRHNLQQEINLHNFIVGPYDTFIKRCSEWVLVFLLVFSAFYAHSFSTRLKFIKFVKLRFAPPPPVFLISFFIAAALLELRLLGVNEAEIAELLITFSVAVYALFCWRKKRELQNNNLFWQGSFLLISTLILALLTMMFMLQFPSLQAGMDARMNVGKKKFAQRYSRLGMMSQSTGLYFDLYKQDAEQPWLLRSLAENHRLTGDEEGFNRFNAQAIALDLGHYISRSNEVEINLSLFASYIQSEQRGQAKKYLKRAVQNAVEQINSSPDSADAFYWLGRVYQIVGEKKLAIQQFEQAVKLNPDGVIYRRAWYQAAQL